MTKSSNSPNYTIRPKLNELCCKLADKFRRTPLAALGDQLIAGVSDCAPSITSGVEPAFLARMQSYLDGFPDRYGARFYFDAALVRNVAAEINVQRMLLPAGNIVPLYASTWGHATIYLFTELRSTTAQTFPTTLELLWLPGVDRPDSVELLIYPWLLHELAHPLIEIHGRRYLADAARSFEAEASARQVRALNDSVAGKERTRTHLAALRDWWQPSGKRASWAIELAADVAALWLCGPAYLHAMDTVVGDPAVEFFRLTVDHPPYELRVLALLQSAHSLGWTKLAAGLETTLNARRSAGRAAERNNRYLALADSGLARAFTTHALELCEQLRLPRFDPAAAVRDAEDYMRDADDLPEPGLGLIRAAYVLRQRLTAARFRAWQERTVTYLADLYTPEKASIP